jgi:hypothetical protein
MEYQSIVTVASEVNPDVAYSVYRMSFGRRMELMREIRKLTGRLEFHEAGASDTDRMDASLLAGEIDRLYVIWGLESVDGLSIDGSSATPETLAAAGPEELFAEALATIKLQCGLTEAERKN